MEHKYIHGEAEEERNRLSKLNELTNKSFLEFVDVKNGEKVLEVGSGLGYLTTSIAEKNSKSEVYGIEISQSQLAECPPKPNNLNYINGDVRDINFEEGTFDVVYGRYILEHLPDFELCLEEVYRVLKPGGKVFFQENTISLMRLYPDCPSFDYVWEKFIDLQSKLGGDAEIGKKLFYYLKKIGFSSVTPSIEAEVHYSEKGTLKAWLSNLIGNIKGAEADLLKRNLVSTKQIQDSIDELVNLSNNPNGLAMFYWNRVSANK